MILSSNTGHFKTGRALNREKDWKIGTKVIDTASKIRITVSLTEQVVLMFKERYKHSRVDTIRTLEIVLLSLLYDLKPICLSKSRLGSDTKLKRLAANLEELYPKVFSYKAGYTSNKEFSRPPVLSLTLDAIDIYDHALHHRKHTGRDLKLESYDPYMYKQLLEGKEI